MSLVQCRFCLEEDIPENLITPCLCKGTFQQIHNKCLYGWQRHQPQKALRCSVCLELFARTQEQPMEILPLYEFQKWFWLRNPTLIIVWNHWMFWTIFSWIWEDTILLNMMERQILFQTLFHIYIWKYASDLLANVKNPSRQWSQWSSSPRIFLPFFYLFSFFSISQTYWVGGIASNYFLFYLFLEHQVILTRLNYQEKFRFISRQPCDEPQSASLLGAPSQQEAQPQ